MNSNDMIAFLILFWLIGFGILIKSITIIMNHYYNKDNFYKDFLEQELNQKCIFRKRIFTYYSLVLSTLIIIIKIT